MRIIRRTALLTLGIGTLLAGTAELSAQDAARSETPPAMADGPTVMATGDAKAFRRARAAVAAVQAKLALEGEFDGKVNGLYGPSTTRAVDGRLADHGDHAPAQFPDLEDWLVLIGSDPSLARTYPVALESPRDVGDAGGTETGTETPAIVQDDPQPPKSLVLMDMGRMTSRGVHSMAVRSTRALIGALQVRLAEEGFWTSTVDGLPGTPAMRDALRAYREQEGLDPAEELDFSTALSLLGLDRTHVEVELASRLDLDHSPVAHDRDLMRRRSYPSLICGSGNCPGSGT